MLKSEIKSRFPDYCASRCIGEGGCGSIVAIGGMCGPCHAKKVWQETLKVIKGNYAEAGTKPGAPPTPSWGALPLPGIAQQALRSLNDVLDKVANSPRGGGSNQRGGTPQSVALTMFIAPKSETATTGGEGGTTTATPRGPGGGVGRSKTTATGTTGTTRGTSSSSTPPGSRRARRRPRRLLGGWRAPSAAGGRASPSRRWWRTGLRGEFRYRRRRAGGRRRPRAARGSGETLAATKTTDGGEEEGGGAREFLWERGGVR